MNFKTTLPLLALVLVLFYACKKNEAAEPEKLVSYDHPELAKIEQAVEKALAELEAEYNNPPSDEEIGTRATVYLEAGSVDGLAAKIAEAGPNGKVVVKSGNHYESGTVMITQMVRLFGEEGANIYFDVAGPGSDFPFVEANVLDPAIHIKDCNQVWIKGLNIFPQNGDGSTGIFLEKGRLARIEGNQINGFQFGIWTSDKSSMARIYDNQVIGSSPVGVWGIVIGSGASSQVKGNHVSKYATCIFASDENGIMAENTTVGGFSGPLLCTVQGNVQLPNGSMLENAIPCKDWLIIKNKAYNSIWNYIVIDGANNNFLVRNESFDPGSGQDMFLLGDSYLTGGFTPTSYRNFVVSLKGFVTVDCGLENTILGGVQLDGPCF